MRPLGRLSCRREFIIKMVVKEIGYEDVGLIHAAKNSELWLALMNMAMNYQVPQKVGNFLNS